MKSFIKYIVIVAISALVGYDMGKSAVNKDIQAKVYREKRKAELLDSLKRESSMKETYRDMSEDLFKKSMKRKEEILNVIIHLDKYSKDAIRKKLAAIVIEEEK